ncbi:MAG: hypothetical protein DYG89_41725 [Caldilinea sp. CFX5]|nr:hypothetical protein [Caldilinea sp. CFX5]
MQKQRLTFRCWHCGRTYAMTRELDGQPTLIVACPFCEKEAVVDLDPYRKSITVVHKGLDDAAVEEYAFPDVIPTTARP